MSAYSFRLDDARSKSFDAHVKRQKRPVSAVLQEIVVAELDRANGRSIPKAASEKEVVELLSERARSGNVAAMGRLLDHYYRAKSVDETVPDELAFLDELAPRRKRRGGS